MADDQPSWLIELTHESPFWSYRAYRITDGLPSAFSLRGITWSRSWALAKAEKDINNFMKDKRVERVEFYG